MTAQRSVENVWDYPRPPSLQTSGDHIVVALDGRVIAETSRSYRVCETSHPPTYYLPIESFAAGVLQPTAGTTVCEWKGAADYFDIVGEVRTIPAGAWTYAHAEGRFADLRGHVAIYPGKVDRCTVNGEVVVAQEGDFYGGWITSGVSGPFKGAPGTLSW